MVNEIESETIGGIRVAEADDNVIPFDVNMIDDPPPLPAIKEMKNIVQ